MAKPAQNREEIGRIRKSFCDGGQGHVFDWWDELSKEERETLTGQLAEIDLDLMNRLAAEHIATDSGVESARLEPAEFIPLPKTKEERKKEADTAARGIGLIRSGEVAVFVVAGGQSSRLGLKTAKGKFPIMPVTGKSLFQHHAEKILAVSRKYDVSIPFFVMTSQTNHEETATFFEENKFFGLSPDDVFFVTQGMLPALDFSGKFILKNKGSLFMSPDGHGGALKTLYRSGAIGEMEIRGIRYVSYFQVDNPLVKVLDPVFLGYHDRDGAEMSSKIVRKTDPQEKVGVIGLIDGRPGVIEYSDMSQDDALARTNEGDLVYSAGSIAIHLINVEFIKKCNEGEFTLPFHKAEKKIPFLDDSGQNVTPEEANGVKFETFVFDALQYARKTVVMEVSRDEEFAPVKNASGEDSPVTSRKALSALYTSWLAAAGFNVKDLESCDVEISPLFAHNAKDLAEKVTKERRLFSSKLYIQ